MKHILITGASTGIGLELSRELCELGFNVIAGVRNTDSMQRYQKAFPDNLQVVKLDVTNVSDIENCLNEAIKKVKNEDEFILVNNAGIAIGGPLEAISITEWKLIFETNVFGLVNVTRYFLPLLRKHNGLVINIGSVSGRIASPFLAPYSASKFAVKAITDSLRRELLDKGVRVVLIEPGPIKTEIWEKSVRQSLAQENQYDEQVKQVYAKDLSLLRKGVEKTAKEAIPAVHVINVITKAILDKKPKTNYLVGKNIYLLVFLIKILPTRVIDKIFSGGFRLKR